MSNFADVLDPGLRKMLERYCEWNVMSRAVAIRHLLRTHPDMRHFADTSIKHPSKLGPKPEITPVPGAPVPGKPGWTYAHPKPPPVEPDQEPPIERVIATADAIVKDLRDGKLSPLEASGELKPLEALGIVYRHSLNSHRHFIDSWESEGSD